MYISYTLVFQWLRKVGFEPTRVLLTDLQSAAFDRSATSPDELDSKSRVVDYIRLISIQRWWVRLTHAQKVLVAQLVEHKTENLGVAGSSPV